MKFPRIVQISFGMCQCMRLTLGVSYNGRNYFDYQRSRP